MDNKIHQFVDSTGKWLRVQLDQLGEWEVVDMIDDHCRVYNDYIYFPEDTLEGVFGTLLQLQIEIDVVEHQTKMSHISTFPEYREIEKKTCII